MTEQTIWDTLLHHGIATFLNSPSVRPDVKDLKEYGAKAAVIGMPFDSTCISRTGTNYGPRALRDASSQFISYHFVFDVDIKKTYNLVDCGDVKVIPGNAEKSLNNGEQVIRNIYEAGAIPILLGGEHLVTVASTRAMSKTFDGNLGFILFDAHLDTAMDVGGEKLNHCCPVTRTMELPHFNPQNAVIIGCTGALNPKEEVEYVREQGITLFSLEDVVEQGIETVARKAVQIAKRDTQGVYLSVDVDVLDAAYAPGTGVPTPGGMTSRELLTALKIIGQAGVNAIDLVEVAPQYDLSNITARMGCRIILDILAANARNLNIGAK